MYREVVNHFRELKRVNPPCLCLPQRSMSHVTPADLQTPSCRKKLDCFSFSVKHVDQEDLLPVSNQVSRPSPRRELNWRVNNSETHLQASTFEKIYRLRKWLVCKLWQAWQLSSEWKFLEEARTLEKYHFKNVIFWN